MQFFDGLRNID